jgi:phosphoribosylanthranilate isomerase
VFQVKICGVCSPIDVPIIAKAGADAIGLNFFPKSKRFLTESEAAEIAVVVPPGIERVGVFVNASTSQMVAAAQRYRLKYLQLHGNEPPEQLAELRGYQIIKAFRFGNDGWQPIESYLASCETHGALPLAVLVDGPASADEFGGTGRTADWAALSDWRSHIEMPLVLAGGLTTCNIARAIETVQPVAVDTASGVERDSRQKDLVATQTFVNEARRCLEKFNRK